MLVVEPTHLKNMIVKLEILPKFRGENNKYFKTPPSQRMVTGVYLPKFGFLSMVNMIGK